MHATPSERYPHARFRIVVLFALALALPGAARSESFLLGLPSSGAPTRVAVGVFLSDVNAVNEQDETVEFEVILTLKWQDPRQAFDPAEAGVSDKIYQGDYQFAELFDGWWPQLILSNKSGSFESQGVLLRVQPDGSLTLIQELNAVAEIPMRLQRFPFDRQQFEALFEVLGLGQDRVVLVPDPGTTGNASQGVNVPHWDLQEVRVSTREYHAVYGDGHAGAQSQLVVTLDMARRPGYMLRLVVLPMTLLLLLTFTVFWMDRESLGDRMDISFIGILSVVAYQFVVSEKMPSISYPTLMDGFVISTYLLLAAGAIINLVVSKLDQAGRVDAGNRVDLSCRRAFPLLFLGANALNVAYFFVFY